MLTPTPTCILIQITAEETALQMMNNRALQSLLQFIQSPNRLTASAVVLIPALYSVLQYELSVGSHQFCPDTLNVASWLYYRGETVRKTLLVHQTEPPDTSLENNTSWQSVCGPISLSSLTGDLLINSLPGRLGATTTCPKSDIGLYIRHSKKTHLRKRIWVARQKVAARNSSQHTVPRD